MTDILHHRGPDDKGYFRDRFASLGHRRLSIVDLSTGQQPMFNEDRNLCIVFNGEIFNHADLRPSLESAGHRYATRSDTETILHAYEQYGEDCVTRFRGMFSFAIWDRSKRTLFCGRDRLGIKPFYYYWDGDTFAFASEIKALLRHPSISARFDSSLLPEYLALGFSSDDRTMFSGIRKLMPGHRLRLSPDTFQIDRYWDLPKATGDDGARDDASWIAECRGRLEETVRMRLMSDVPLGMFLSGGVDSSAIAALMSRMVSGRVKTFAVGYDEATFSELGYAREVAEAIGTEHHEVVIGKNDFFGALPKLIWHEDEPIVWPSSVSLYFVSKLAAQRVKVVLTGEGSDELFGGYSRYRFHLQNQRSMTWYSRVPRGVRRNISSVIEGSDLIAANVRRKLGHTLLGREPTVESFYLDNFYSAFSEEEQQRLLVASVKTNNAYGSFLEHWLAGSGDALGQLLYADQKTYLVELLMKQDQMSMAASIESRVPFLDHPFVEFASRVPDHLKIRGDEGKYILKKAVSDLLPHGIIHRRKMGFPTPLSQWLRGRTADNLLDVLRDPGGLVAEYVDRSLMDALLDRHARGKVDATDRIWRLLNLQLWGQIFLNAHSSSGQSTYDENTVGQV
jgi:asparagine synthase (glutamine-hydrolysing)